MKWTIIVLIMMSLIGSMMWVMPSPRQRFQSRLRLEARKFGFNVNLAQLNLPRATGEVEPEKRNMPAYRMLRANLDRRERDAWIDWGVCRVNSQATTGLNAGWSWMQGEGRLDAGRLARLNAWLAGLPPEVEAVESTALQLSFYWREPEAEGALQALVDSANTGLEQKL